MLGLAGVTAIDDSEAMVIVRLPEVAAFFAASVHFAVKVDVPLAGLAPEISPEEDKLRPEGSPPELMVNV
jgi:hypothetical protein